MPHFLIQFAQQHEEVHIENRTLGEWMFIHWKHSTHNTNTLFVTHKL